MSNQIVQLTDKDNNNIFPVAGSMAGESIETGMIQDAAVTLGKIDSTTLKTDLLSQITWGEGVALNGGNYNYTIKDNLTNRVDISISVMQNATIPAKYSVSIGVLPSSIRPIRNVILNCSSYLNTVGGAFIRSTTGEIVVWFVDQVTSVKEIGVNGSWYV